MEKQKPVYYQYQKSLNYQIFLKMEGSKVETELSEVFEMLGFSKVDEETVAKTPVHRFETKVLKLDLANPRVARQIQGFGGSLENYGPESLSNQGDYQLYRYQGVGVMVWSENSASWELGFVKPSENKDKIKVMLTRFLSWALGPKGIVGFWGVPVEEGFVVMKPIESNFEAVFVDIGNMSLITQDGVRPIEADLQILRLDSTLMNETKKMQKEALLSFLSANTSYFSYHGLNPAMRKSLYELASFAQGIVYPVANFRPRAGLEDAG